MKRNEAKQLIRECLNEIIEPRIEDRWLKRIGTSIVESLIAWGVNVEKWNIYEHDKNIVILQLSFKLIKYKAIWTLLNMIARYNGDLRMYPDKEFISVDIRLDKKNLK